MNNLTAPLRDHHKHCDDLFAEAEVAAHDGDWPGCAENFARFRNELEAHLATEEQVLFPALDGAADATGGPTEVMRQEHAQMRELVAQMSAALEQRKADAFGGGAETLLILMQQHNMKEEHILYPMCNRAIASGSIDVDGALRDRLAAVCGV